MKPGRRGIGGKLNPPVMPTPCVKWPGRINPEGYGKIDLPRPQGQVYAHRFFYEAAYGPIPDGLTVDHLCWNTRCVNVAHMELVTLAENARRASARITHCPEGHPYDEVNTRYYVHRRTGGIWRKCRTCHRLRERERARRRAA